MKKFSKGFTLTELTISLTVSLIVMGIVSSIIAISKNNMVITTKFSSKSNEIYSVEKFINNWFYSYSNEDYVLVMPEENLGDVVDENGDTVKAYRNNAQHELKFALKPQKDNDGNYILGSTPIIYRTLVFNPVSDQRQLICEYPSGTQTMDIKQAKDIIFTKNKSLVKVTLVYEDDITYTILLNNTFYNN